MLIKTIEQKCTDAFIKAFDQLSSQQFTAEITRSTQDKFGHYQCNSAMKLSKLLNMPPRNIATSVVAQLEQHKDSLFENIEIAGPGFINITLSKEFLSKQCREIFERPQVVAKTQTPQKITIDLSSPNTAKEMHVGHLRSTIIGDSLARMFEYLGHDVLRLNHIGDWGTSFGMLIAYIKNNEPSLVEGSKQVDLSTLVMFYKQAKKLFDENEDFKKQSQLMVVSLQNHESDAIKLWEMICDISRKAYQEIYDILDVK
ncbi:MAG: arginine--tRNA ligase, partial [Candidatus Berkiella sp.]